LSPKRRILLLNWNDTLNPWGGGAEVHLHETFRRIAARGHEVTLLCSGWKGCRAEEMVDGIRVVRIAGRYTFHLAAPGEVRRRTRGGGADVVVEALNKIPLCSPLYVRTPVLGIGHHLFGSTIFREAPLPFSLYVYACELAVPWVYRGCRMAVISESTREDFVARGLSPDRVRVVYVGVDHREYRPDAGVAPEPTPTLLALGRLRKYKRLDLVIDAVVELARTKHPGLTLVIAGAGKQLDAHREHARRLDAESIVRFRGVVSEEEKVDLYRRAWALVVTSPKEGWGLTCLEAEACGTPVIASDSPGLREAVRGGETGILVPHGKRRALVEAMDRYLSDAALRARLREGALRFAESFTWERCADETMEMIEQTIATREEA
jgi:glycosyltransferase involved in cell wall biosynthesis